MLTVLSVMEEMRNDYPNNSTPNYFKRVELMDENRRTATMWVFQKRGENKFHNELYYEISKLKELPARIIQHEDENIVAFDDESDEQAIKREKWRFFKKK